MVNWKSYCDFVGGSVDLSRVFEEDYFSEVSVEYFRVEGNRYCAC